MSAFDAVDGASSAASKWYRMIASKPERFKEVRPGAFEVFKELARTRRRNADTVDPGIGRTRLGQRTLKCVFLIGTRSAHSIRASGLTAAQTGRTHDRTRPMLQQRQKVLAKAPSTHDPKRIWPGSSSCGDSIAKSGDMVCEPGGVVSHSRQERRGHFG